MDFIWIIAGVIFIVYKLVSESKHGEAIGESVRSVLIAICAIVSHVLTIGMIVMFFIVENGKIHCLIIALGAFLPCIPWYMAIADAHKYKKTMEEYNKKQRDYEEKYSVEERQAIELQKKYDYVVESLSSIGKRTTHENVMMAIQEDDFEKIKSTNNPYCMYYWICRLRTVELEKLPFRVLNRMCGARISKDGRNSAGIAYILKNSEGLDEYFIPVNANYVNRNTPEEHFLSFKSKNGKKTHPTTPKEFYSDLDMNFSEDIALCKYASKFFNNSGYHISDDMVFDVCCYKLSTWRDITEDNVSDLYKYLCKKYSKSYTVVLEDLELEEQDIPLDPSIPEIIAIDRRRALLTNYFLRKNGLEFLNPDPNFLKEDEYYAKIETLLNAKYDEYERKYDCTPLEKREIVWASSKLLNSKEKDVS